ncbi:hypothetical protein [Echinicola rosea]|uniref:hypothetical protein n=1 Tax=Echinicola rosea TaxID=1807691 RepID=UPI0010CA9332|nr:hypothetical protein [Echinicola rosea]
MNLLKSYVDILEESGGSFDESYLPLIQWVVDDAGFPQPDKNPKKAIKSLSNMHLEWNKKLSMLDVNSHEGKIDQKKPSKNMQLPALLLGIATMPSNDYNRT